MVIALNRLFPIIRFREHGNLFQVVSIKFYATQRTNIVEELLLTKSPPSPAEEKTSNLSVKPQAPNSNAVVNLEYYNRNPRNMEMMNLALKHTGWTLDADRRDFYNKLFFERTADHTRAYVMHTSGRKVVSASTEEFAIARHLYRYTDASAAENIGRILARRMLETGILYVYSSYTDEHRKSEKMNIFLNSLIDGGVQLSEMPRVTTPNPFGDLSARYLKSTSIRRHPRSMGPRRKAKPVIMPQEVD